MTTTTTTKVLQHIRSFYNNLEQFPPHLIDFHCGKLRCFNKNIMSLENRPPLSHYKVYKTIKSYSEQDRDFTKGYLVKYAQAKFKIQKYMNELANIGKK